MKKQTNKQKPTDTAHFHYVLTDDVAQSTSSLLATCVWNGTCTTTR